MVFAVNKKELLELIKAGEGYALEFKEDLPSDLGRHICAFANASGGKIILGVKDDGSMAGCSLGNAGSSKIHDIARNLDPPFNVGVERVGNLAVITVAEGENKPYSSGGHFYLRIGSTTQQMQRDEIREFFQQERLVRFDEKPNRDFDFSNDFDKWKFKSCLSKAGISAVTADKDILRNFSLLDGNYLKNAGVLFFSHRVTKFFISAIVTCGLYEGTDKHTILDKKEFNADILSNYENAITYVFSKLNTNYIIGAERVERLELPEDALREAIINAIVHRDYSSAGHVQIDIFLDRVEISNPGVLSEAWKRGSLAKEAFRETPCLWICF